MNKLSRDDNLLFLAGVHGDEKIGIRVLQKLQKQSKRFSWLVANPKAVKKDKRFIDDDLNRVAPGDRNSNSYEKRRSAELLKIARGYSFVIDIHDNKTPTGLFTIITNPKPQNLKLAAVLPISKIVIWPSTSQNGQGPITQFVSCGVEIEIGPNKFRQVEKELFSALKKIVDDKLNLKKESLASKKIFWVYGKIKKDEILNAQMQQLHNFQKIRINKEQFYPLLVGQYSTIVCYKMKRLYF